MARCKKSTWAPRTLRIRDTALRCYLLPAFGHVPLAQLTPAHIQGAYQRWAEAGKAPATILNVHRTLRTALRDAVRWDLIPRSVVALVSPPRAPVRPMTVWDEEQMRLFFAAARRSSQWWLLYECALLTGMRIGELLALRWADLDWRRRLIRVTRTIGGMSRAGAVYREPKTTYGRRAIDVPRQLLASLRAWHLQHGDHELIFCAREGRPLWGSVILRDFYRVARLARLPRIRLHDLRHSHATALLAQGESIKLIQERLGHSAPSITLNIYAHLLPTIQQHAVDRLERRLRGRRRRMQTEQGNPGVKSEREGPA